MTRRKLPIGIQTFRTIREDGCYYVDKTPYLRRLVDEGTHYFLSRPRRFGKSLFLDTLKEAFEGNQALFEGLAVHEDWDWSVRHPVLRLSFGGGTFLREGDVAAEVADQLELLEKDVRMAAEPAGAPERLHRLIRTLHERAGQRVVVLVDEYDKPVLDALNALDLARANRDFLCGLYSVVKDCDAHVHFSFFTGVCKFATGNLFSGLNNLIDITRDPRYSGICGYTDADLESVFEAELSGLDLGEIRSWCGGYGWLGEEKVYNPHEVLRLFRNRRFDERWFDTAVPAFLIDMLIERGVDPAALDDTICDGQMLSYLDVDDIVIETLLFQTGCLTIIGTEDLGGLIFYRLGLPNQAVRRGLEERLARGGTVAKS